MENRQTEQARSRIINTNLTEGPVIKKILIVEDNSDYRELMNLFITKMGYRAKPGLKHPLFHRSRELRRFDIHAIGTFTDMDGILK